VNIRTSKQNLIITESGRPVITVDRRKTIEAVKIRRRAYYRDYKRLRKQHDPAFKLIEKLKPELSAALIGKIKSIGLKSLLGCSVAELRQHFESLFEPDMSWRNYGSLLHIDHNARRAGKDLFCAFSFWMALDSAVLMRSKARWSRSVA